MNMLDILIEELDVVGLLLNHKKTKVLTTEADHQDEATLATGEPIKILGPEASHKWLGRMLSTNAQHPFKDDLDTRLSAANRAFFKRRSSLCCRQIPLGTRLRLFEATVTPVACYAAGCRPLKQADARRLDVAYR